MRWLSDRLRIEGSQVRNSLRCALKEGALSSAKYLLDRQEHIQVLDLFDTIPIL